jgi:ABC-type amino acid transport system permease subunit
MSGSLFTPLLGSVVIWAISGSLALVFATALAVGSIGRSRPVRAAADTVILLTRGIPTSLLIIAAGLAALPHRPPGWLPDPFPGTSPGMTLLAWAVTVALAVGSAGHLAVIFRTGYHSLGEIRLDQLAVLAVPPTQRLRLIARESAAASLAPTGARMVHHLHNTAFAALFPVADLFGWVQQQAYETFEVTRYAAIGTGLYIVLSLLIWAATRTLEHRLGAGRRNGPVRVEALGRPS